MWPEDDSAALRGLLAWLPEPGEGVSFGLDRHTFPYRFSDEFKAPDCDQDED